MKAALFIIYLILTIYSFYILAVKSGIKNYVAYIPLYNALKVTNKPWWWLLLFIVPGINIMMLLIVIVLLSKSFGKYSTSETIMALILGPVYLLYIAYDKKSTFVGPSGSEEYRKKRKLSKSKEWWDAILFAIIAATIIRSFFIEAYTIPTSSMEKTLLVGDFLFVSKVNYGARIPMTPIAFPFAHHTMPLIGGKSYLQWWHIDYHRIPGFQKIKNNDIVVFNYPMDDLAPLYRPVDKKENYIKRCVGISGDSIKVIDKLLYVNNKPVPLPSKGQFRYLVTTDGAPFRKKTLLNFGITEIAATGNTGEYIMWLNPETISKLKALTNIKSITAEEESAGLTNPNCFPGDTSFHWNMDFYGPIWIPKKGVSIPMTLRNYSIYERTIRVYEHNPTLELRGQQVYLDGNPIKEYTFKMDYFWMMGDNRHNSQDSRIWGFVPEDHIVGKALFIWMSWDKNASGFNHIRWNRLFTAIHKKVL
jgi:signal peptidase I